eukprot:jgi/Mesen1/4699/ME000241S03736
MGNICGFRQVDQSTVGVIEHFGKFDRIARPGCHFVPWCCCFNIAGLLSIRIQQLDVRCETKTKDNVFVTVVASIQYCCIEENIKDAFYKLANPREQIQAYVFDVVRGSVPKMDLDDVFIVKNEIAKTVEEELEKAMHTYGYRIVQTLIVDIEPDHTVKKAMNEINAAQRFRMAANEKAEAEKILQVKRAEGEAEAKYLSGVGVARQRQYRGSAVARPAAAAAADGGLAGGRANCGYVVQQTSSSRSNCLMLVAVKVYFDTMKEIGASSKNTTVFIPHGPGNVADIATQVRNGFMEAGGSMTGMTR